MSEPYLIWSGEHKAYYRPLGHGYTSDLYRAGVFTEDTPINEEKRERKVFFDEIRDALSEVIWNAYRVYNGLRAVGSP
jgi:hypothetical protein